MIVLQGSEGGLLWLEPEWKVSNVDNFAMVSKGMWYVKSLQILSRKK